MSTVECFPYIFDDETITVLKKNNIRTALDFLNESPESIGKILKLRFKVSYSISDGHVVDQKILYSTFIPQCSFSIIQDVVDVREKLVDAFREKPSTALNFLNRIRENRFTIPSGIQE